MDNLRELALFAGAGGGILGGALLGWRTVCAVEINPYCQRVLMARQRDGLLPDFPIWDDVQTFDGVPWRGLVDVISGGFPCQDISVAGRGAGIDGIKSGMWRHFARIIREVGPRYVFVENSPALVTRGLGRVLGDLAALGYDARWGVLGAVDVGAPHQRDRLWIRAELANAHRGGWDGRSRQAATGEVGQLALGGELANAHGAWQPQQEGGEQEQRGRLDHGSQEVANAHGGRQQERDLSACAGGQGQHPWADDPAERGGAAESGMGRVAHGVARRVDRLKAIGNGQVPLVAATAWRLLGGEE